jgi:hypothetical protein
MRRFGLRADADPQTYALGLKEVWEVCAAPRPSARALHTVWVCWVRAERGTCHGVTSPGLLTATFVTPHWGEAARQGCASVIPANRANSGRAQQHETLLPFVLRAAPAAAQQGRLVLRAAWV